MRICIVNHVGVAWNPRTLKEADALADAGHDVRVATVSHSRAGDLEDQRLVRDRIWTYRTVSYRRDGLAGAGRWAVSGYSLRLHRALARLTHGFGIAERGFSRYRFGMLAMLLDEPTDLYIAHNLQSLPVAAWAAQRSRALLGFDIEDYHVDEEPPWLDDELNRHVKAHLMRKYLPRCAHLTTTSECMADAVVEDFDVRRPTVLYNVFPLAYRAKAQTPSARAAAIGPRGGSYTAYWFSQTVGPDRGLQDVIRALPGLTHRVDLHLRGRCPASVKRDLTRLASLLGVGSQLVFHEAIAADDLVADAARFDFGLALEQPFNRSRDLSVTNKLFVYLLAGIVPVFTSVSGQREVMDRVPSCGVGYEPGDVAGLTAALNRVLERPEQIEQMKTTAWDAATTRFCWDVERGKLVDSIDALAVAEVAGARRRQGPGRRVAEAAPRPLADRIGLGVDIPILMYHDVVSRDTGLGEYAISARLFEQHLAILKNDKYDTITFFDLFDILDGRRQRTGREVILTFDDGYESVRSVVAPALGAHGMKGTVFVVAGEIGGSNQWDREKSDRIPRRRLLDEAGIERIVAAGMRLGSHGWRHRDLTTAGDAECHEEIAASKEFLERTFDVEVPVFSFPYGRHRREHVAMLEKSGYRGGVTIFSDERRVTSNRFLMRRVYVHANDGPTRFRLKLTPAYLRFRRATDGKRADRARAQ